MIVIGKRGTNIISVLFLAVVVAVLFYIALS